MINVIRISTINLRDNMSESMNEVAYGNKRLLITRRQNEICALISLKDLKRLIALDNKEFIDG